MSSFTYMAKALECGDLWHLLGTASDDGAEGHPKAKVISQIPLASSSNSVEHLRTQLNLSQGPILSSCPVSSACEFLQAPFVFAP